MDGDGFLEYRGASGGGSPDGLRNQGWKDSFDAVFHASGELAEGPIALCEVQGYAYAAKRAASQCARRLGDCDQAGKFDAEADELARRFEEAFWCEEIGVYAIALDGNKKACRIRASNAGQLLWTGIARADRARRIADAMVSPAYFSGWGIRTLAKGEPRYNPMSYHNGSVWPHDNSLIALGLSRYGFYDHAEKVFEATLAAASYMELRRLPELYCGFRRRPGAGAILYPVACSPQAWASGALFLMIQAAAGHRIRTGRAAAPLPKSPVAGIGRSSQAPTAGDERRHGGYRVPAHGRESLDARSAEQRRDSGVDDPGLNAARHRGSSKSDAWFPRRPIGLDVLRA